MKKATYDGQVGYYDETTEDFYPEGALKKAEVEGKTGLYNPETEDFFPMDFAGQPAPTPNPTRWQDTFTSAIKGAFAPDPNYKEGSAFSAQPGAVMSKEDMASAAGQGLDTAMRGAGIVAKGAKQIPETLGRTAANVGRAVGEIERGLTPEGVPNVIADFGDVAADSAATYDAILKEREQRDTEGLSDNEKILYGAPASIAANVPSLAAGVVTGGVAPALTVMGIGKAADRLAEFRDAGKSLPVSIVGAGLSAGAEVAPEAIPMGWLLNKGTPAIKAVAKYVIGEQAQEQITAFADNLIDWAIKRPDMTVAEWIDKVQLPAMKQTAIATAIQAPVTGALARGGMKLLDRAQTPMPPPTPRNLDEYIEQNSQRKLITPAPVAATPPVQPNAQPVAGEGLELAAGEQGQNEPVIAQNEPVENEAFPGAGMTHDEVMGLGLKEIDAMPDDRLAKQLALYRAGRSPVSSLPNRAAFDDLLNDANKTNKEYHFVSADLDGFKTINDTLGHHVGDAVLMGVRTAAKEAGIDLDSEAYHQGGDEFGFAFSAENGTAKQEALTKALERAIVEVKDEIGNVVGTMTGIGATVTGRLGRGKQGWIQTDSDLKSAKSERERKGERPARGSLSLPQGVHLSPEVERRYRAGRETQERLQRERAIQEGRGNAAAVADDNRSNNLSQTTTTFFDPKAVPVVRIPVFEIQQSKDVPNFKAEADQKTGVVRGEQLKASEYNELGTGPVVLWQRLDGRLEIITGRHRLDLARRTGKETIPAQVVSEANGFTKKNAITFDAEANIRDGMGRTEDFAHYFKNSPEIAREEAEGRGLLSRAKGQAGFDLANHSSEEVYTLWRNKQIKEDQALAIVRSAPDNAKAQDIGARYAREGKNADYVANIVRVAVTNSGGEGGNIDLFGNDDSAIAEMEAQAKRASAIQRELRDQVAAVQGAAKRPEAARKLGVDVKNPESVKAKIAELKAEAYRWDSWPQHPDLVARVRGESYVAPPVQEVKPAEKPDIGLLPFDEAFALTPEQPKVATPKPVQSGIDLGLKGDALRAPERGVGSSEPTELERAANEKADREKQGGFFDSLKNERGAVGNLESVKETKEPAESKNLVTVHNISIANVRHAMKMGGIPVPSLAAIDINKSNFHGFGDITLIAKKGTFAPERSRENKWHGADAYSPRYPSVTHFITKNTADTIKGWLADTHQAIQKKPTGDKDYQRYFGEYSWENDIEREGISEALKRNELVQAAYLKESGSLPKGLNNTYEGKEKVRKAIEKSGRDKFEAWVDSKVEALGLTTTEKIFKGFSYSGKRQYLSHDLDTVVKLLKSQMKEGEGFNYGAGSVRSKVTPQFKTLKQIQESRDKVISSEEFEKVKDEANEELIALADHYKSSLNHPPSNAFGFPDTFSEHLKEAIDTRNFRKTFDEYYDKGVDLKPAIDFVEKLRNMPTEYFEGEIQRAVSLNEFDAAIVPHDTPSDVTDALKQQGVKIVQYKKGDIADRKQKVKDVTTANRAEYLYSLGIIHPEEIIKNLRLVGNDMKAAYPHLVELGTGIYRQGYTKYAAFQGQMKTLLGDMWASFKSLIEKVYFAAKKANAKLGQSGNVGEKSKLNDFQRKQVASPEFKAWFKDSKVVDENGNPLVVYHGTADSVTAFSLDHPNRKDSGWLGTGVYLTTDKDLAHSYANIKDKGGESGPNVMPLYASLKNPYNATLKEKQSFQLISHQKGAAAGRAAADAWTKELASKGHDGVVLQFEAKDVGEKNVSKEIVVFNPSMVKSATGNTGKFDSKNPVITASFPAGTILQAIRAAKDAKAAYPHLVKLGQRVMLDGKTKFADFQNGMKSYLGDLWQKFKSRMMDIYFAAKAANKKLGERGSIGENKNDPPYRRRYPTARGGWTKDKIKRALRHVSSEKEQSTFNKELMKFDSPEEVAENLYFHGSGAGISGLKPSVVLGKNEFRSGGYGEDYWGISLSKSKETASNFTGDRNHGNVAPVLVKKGATIKAMPEIQDAAEIEDHIEQLWNEGVDAVIIGDHKTKFSEQEIVILNPRAIVVGKPESFAVFQKKRFSEPTREEIADMYKNSADNYIAALEKAGKPNLVKQHLVEQFREKNKESYLKRIMKSERGSIGEKKPTLSEWMKAVETAYSAGKKVPASVIEDYLKRGGTSKSIIDARGAEIAKSLDLIYNGIQEKVDGTPDLVLFTDKETKGTMSVKVGIASVEAVKARLGEMKAAFAKVASKKAIEPAIEKAAKSVDDFIDETIGSAGLAVRDASKVKQTNDKIVIPGGSLESESKEVEFRWQKSKGAVKQKLIDRIKEAAHKIAEMRHHFPGLTKEDAKLKNILREYENVPEYSKHIAMETTSGILAGLGPKKYDVFTRNIVLPDMMRDIESGLLSEDNLPFGYKSKGQVARDLEKFKKLANANPDIKKAIAKREEFNRVLRDALVDKGLLSEDVKKDDAYFHHQVLQYMDAKRMGLSSGDVRMKSKGFQKGRKGSGLDYNTEYVESEFEWVSQAIQTLKTAETMDRIKSAVDISERVKADAKKRGIKNWRDAIPEGYTTWQPKKGTNLYRGVSVPEKVLDEVMAGERELTEEDLRKVLVMGGKRTEWVVPERVAVVLDEFRKFDSGPIDNFTRGIMSSWKQWTLLNPLRVIRYNLNNMSGDMDIAMAYDPRILKFLPESWREAKAHYKGKAMSPDMRKMLENGVIGSALSVQEIPDIRESGIFQVLTGENQGVIDRYWSKTKDMTALRENLLRIAAYKYFKAEIAKGKTVYGASDRSQVDAETNVEKKAALLARDLIGDYGNISKAGQWLRTHMIPFFSWMEINAPRYVRLMQNMAAEERGGSARMGAVAAGKVVKGGAKLAVKMTTLYTLVALWNEAAKRMLDIDDDEERGLYGERKQYHIILGRREDGSLLTLRFQGALSDALDWFGMGNAPATIKDIAEGKKTVGETAVEMAKAPVNKIVNASHPILKTGYEVIMGKSLYPDIFSPRPIRDKAEHSLRLLSLDLPYKYLTGKPTRGASKDALGAILYSNDPGEGAYWNARKRVYDFLEDEGKEQFSVTPTKKSTALYYYKQAKRFKDAKAEEKYLQEYTRLGGTAKQFVASMKRQAPTASVPAKLREKFESVLSEKDKRDIALAEKWYEDHMSVTDDEIEKIEKYTSENTEE